MNQQQHPSRHRRARVALVASLWLLAIVLSAMLDTTVADAMRRSGIEDFLRAPGTDWLRHVLKAPGEYWFTVVVMLLAWLLFPACRRAAALVLVGTAVSGLNHVIKWMVGRTRPFSLEDHGHTTRLAPFDLDPFTHGLPGLIGSRNLCFPSGHAALAFATAAAMGILWPRWRWGLYAVACLVGIERVAEHAHWFSDVVAAAALGIGGVWAVRRLWWDRFSAAPAGRAVDVLKPVSVRDSR
jgi:membrane-associated phospholipid phosphatase